MRNNFIIAAAMLLGACGGGSPGSTDPLAGLSGYQHFEGFIDMYWDGEGGRLLLKIDDFDSDFIYMSGLARGIGSNDIGLDRGQMGSTRIVRFQRSGPRVLMIEQNTNYRANSDNANERQAVDESFARSVAWGFDVIAERDGGVFIDISGFAARDAHGIADRLREMEEGEYAVDANRSAIYLPRTKGFPDNTEAEAIVTLTGRPTGEILATVVPDPTSITVHMHHSFVRLPDDGYRPLPYDPRSGIIGSRFDGSGFADYASAIGEPLFVNYGRRHRLEKIDPSAEISEAVEPIVYYVDRGAPEPVRSALIEGASWWNEAFEAAGYKDAFRVEMMPEGADPMDVRYNVIQWVHRSTRGWSYGFPIVDPRTMEIIKGHVSLGSLRVRQDFMIAEGLLAPYAEDAVPGDMLEMSLARIRQLSAHEVGHTLGVEHNFAASTQDRASVMDYPFPLVKFGEGGALDLSDAYSVGMGGWDNRVILYAYQDFPDGVDEDAERQKILAETISNFRFLGDQDARATGSAHPHANLWDNGEDAVAELRHLLRVRSYALENFSENNIRVGRPMADLEEVLVPIYLLHRYQVRAVGKLIGGQYFDYALRGDGQRLPTPVAGGRQREAMGALLDLLDPAALELPASVVELIPPRPIGHPRTRESFPRHTGITFDPVGPADSAVALTLATLLDGTRAARMIAQKAQNASLPGFAGLLESLLLVTWFDDRSQGMQGLIQRRTNMQTLHALMRLSVDLNASAEARSMAYGAINAVDNWLAARTLREQDVAWRAMFTDARLLIGRFRDDPGMLESIPPVVIPPGSPIGDGMNAGTAL